MLCLRDAPRLSALLSSLVLAISIVSAAGGAHAQRGDDERARQLYLRGDRLYAEGRYEAAVEAFQESYRLSGRPLLLFNLANAYERLARYEEALASLRRYAPHAPVEEEDQIRARIESLSRRAEEQQTAEQTTEPGDDEALDQDTERAPPAASGGDDELVLVGAVLTGAGAALMIGGGVFGGLALDARGEASTGCADASGATVCDAAVRDALDRDATYALVADIGLFGGAAVAAAGVVLLVIGLTSSDRETARREGVTPTFGASPTGGEVGLVGAF